MVKVPVVSVAKVPVALLLGGACSLVAKVPVALLLRCL